MIAPSVFAGAPRKVSEAERKRAQRQGGLAFLPIILIEAGERLSGL